MAKTVCCPTCFYHGALLEDETVKPETPEYVGSIYCPYCESGMSDLENKLEKLNERSLNEVK